MQNIETQRLRLRHFIEADAQGLLEYLRQPRVNCFLDDKINTLQEAQLKIQKRSKDDSYIAVCLKDTNELIGELFALKEEPDTYCVGWNFNARFEGKGYASESVQALFQYLFTQMQARRLYAYVEDDNYRSQKLCERFKMRQEGCFVEFVSMTTYEDGTPKYENTFQYALLKKEWLQHQSM
ncbi:GNAT family N-acetyltransferase [Paenibacillus sp. KACC 21273]|uniref:GNAT family N-acetyltransferase n=1 Tax=Paenibacillus sp. KACC 21273 TaxID=3025665 RepID=UPI002365F13F|nr:GNAT family N-acetyltransferase [Paenibacillus sp. KACC 21273]WDF51923.1 GNAT family N-acetyltransferase [Paenibacillus sp. KACC 21273]